MTTGEQLRVMIVEDQELVRSGFVMILQKAGLEVVGEATDGDQALQLARALPPERAPHVVLVDIQLPRMNGIELTRHLLRLLPRTKVVALTTFDLDEYVHTAVQAGASGFLHKHVSPAELVHAVRAASTGDTVLAPSLTRRLLERFVARPLPGRLPDQLSALSDQELAVVRLVARGFTNGDIGRRLFLSEATVKTYLSRVLGKLGLRDRVQLAVLAYDSGLVQPGETDDAAQ